MIAIAFDAAGGKPTLSGGELSFRLAHAGDLALLAMAASRPVSIDLERIADANYAVIASSYFASAAQQALRGLPPEQRRAAFYQT